METATIFSVGFYNKIPTGALLLISDQPMVPEGVKTEESDRNVTTNYVEQHLRIGIDSLKQLINNGLTVNIFAFDIAASPIRSTTQHPFQNGRRLFPCLAGYQF